MKTINEKSTPLTAMLEISQILKSGMRKTFLTMGVGLVLSQAVTFSSRAADPAMRTLERHVPAIVSQLKAKGTLSPDTSLSLAIGLPLRNQAALTNLLGQIYDPSSANYHHFLTPAEFTEKFGPTEQDYAQVANFAKVNGLTVTHTHGNRILLDVSGKASDIGKAFHTTLKTFKHPKENRDFFAPDVEPTVDAALPILAVQGMNNYQLPQPMFKKMVAPGAIPANGSGLGGSYIGQDFRNAYVPGSNLRGSGQIVGLLQFDGYFSSDIATYMSMAGMTNVPLENVLLDGFNGTPGPANGEVCLDIEMCSSMAPALAKIVVFEAGLFGNPNDILSSMAARSEIKQLSASWGYTTDAASDQLFQQLALQGQTFFNASGDSDTWVGTIQYGSVQDQYITIVGGTALTMNGQGVSYASETVWNDRTVNPSGGNWGSGGGISTTIPIPIWQQGLNMTNNHGSSTFRNMPDVALTAENVFLVEDGGFMGITGGTSAASPLWAGFMALINQQAAANGKSSIGFLPSAIYALGKTADYTNCFHDITLGDNTWPGSPTNFFAVPGYDLATGWGTPNGTSLINALTAVGVTNTITHLSAPPPPYGSTLSALNGGNPNGTWQLFVLDDAQFNTGIISNGWILTLTSASPVGYSADLALAMTASAGTVAVSNNFYYTLTVTNYGPSVSSNVLVSDTLPMGVTVVSSTVTQGTITGLDWKVGTLAVNAGAQLIITVMPTAPGTILNYATATATTPDANPADGFASVTVVVNEPPLLTPSFHAGSGAFQLTVTGLSGQSAIIQASTNLLSGIWIPVYTNFIPFTFTNFDSTNFPMRFYRVLVGP